MEELLVKLRRIYPDKYAEMKKAHDFAKVAHEGQKRSSGEDYFTHPCAVVDILSNFGFDSSTVTAAFLHDVLEDTEVTPEQLKEQFGEEILELVEGVTKLDKLQFVNREEAQAENFRKIFVAMAKDLRVIIIKLADRLHNMRSLQYLSKDRQDRIARETLDIYAPLAGRLGISFFKCELEDLAMKYLLPTEYKYISESVNAKRSERQKFLDAVCAQIVEKLKEMGIAGEVNGRPKHFYSVYKKMHNAHIDIDQIYDLLAVRIIVDSVKDCYTMLGEIHTMWKPIPGRFKDYIAMPKANNYQSLHTTVVTPFNETFEIQIRTHEMHRIAEYGIAAHWKYKEGTTGNDSALDNKVRWLREVMDAQQDIDGAKEFMDAIKINVFDDEVFVFTPKGDVHGLPIGSTPVDLAYKIHSQIGNKCVGAKVNKKIVPLSTKLANGDIVEIITSPTSKGPSFDWLKFVRSASARSKIRAYFKKEKRDENIERGRDMLEREAKRRGYALGDIMTHDMMQRFLQRHGLETEEDLYAEVGYGGLTTNQVLSKIIETFKKEAPAPEIEDFVSTQKIEQKPARHSKSGVLVNGNANFTVRMAQCCSPIPGDPIVGYISRGRGVSVHRADCPNIKGMEDERLIQVSWDNDGNEYFNAMLIIKCENRAGLLASITSYIAGAKLEITSASARADDKDSRLGEIDISVRIKRVEQLEELVKKLKTIKGIIEIRR
ncbi:MAG: bifunctional (p)ppGpp synthetase/guanosine-3',5'-bis(diphosphate) 3'-pyrophosphohydrolase [Bacteroides sp.]|nr:bifunctional (p)ppGpp synthetase/guanosine-3',5'-bis(diphosphate) 3'-pyrophosphohydrolase [Bacillota bacterium]MCM1394061.1 bifunctional (p)ppGpp synthetase/guanosine-3',5'-bis(diphosphate) 3'-pyrophosphohydrolase [[Eubacterium] siraeum]MCM1455580.1 bifunctional (p)ppGpp synthetase/guanosine-3',5'-bis(diphosphate) 3'-pyrophosphohydrolase [Bacteroides sp.]